MKGGSTTPVIFMLALAAFASTTAFRICDPLLPVLAQEFGVRTAQASYAVTVFSVAYGVMQFFYGPVGDRYGKFHTLACATLGCAAGSLIVASAPTFELLLVGRFLAGATAAGIVPLSRAWIGDHVPYEQRQATLARFLLGTITGMASGQVLGGGFADLIGWRWAFVALACVYLGVGALLISRRHLVTETLSTASRGARFLSPLWQVLLVPWARVVLLTVFLEGALVFGALAFVPAYLHEHLGLPVSWAGAIGGLFGLGAMGYALRANQLVRRLGERRLVFFGGCLLSLACATFWLAPTWGVAAAGSVVCGFGYYLLHAVLQTNATQMAPAMRGTAVALFASCLFLGQSVGVAGAGLLADLAGLAAVFPVSMVLLPLLAATFAWRLRFRRAAGYGAPD